MIEEVAVSESNSSDNSKLNDDKKDEISNTSGSTPNSNSSQKQSSGNIAQGSIEEKAMQVIRGNFGNGIDRKNALGNEYAVIQAKVNELLRNNTL